MQTADKVRTLRAQTGSGHTAHAAGGHGRWRFLRHYLEMVAAMLVGMVALGAAVSGVLALAVTMSVGMVAWMRHRGHGWASTLEMAGAMFTPAVALVPLLWLGVIAGDTLLLLEHLAMFPLMYLVMRRRRAEYGGASGG
jgi:hypothetical protein